MTATTLSLNLNTTTAADEKPIHLNAAQSRLRAEVLEWLKAGHPKLKAIHGFAGTGKTFAVKYILQSAYGLVDGSQPVLVGDTWACAPTHQAKGVLKNALKGAPIKEVVTAHSLLGLRPQKVRFGRQDEQLLEECLGISLEERTSDDEALIDSLQVRRNAAVEGKQDFVQTKIKKGLEGVRLIVVDEWSMISANLFGLFVELTCNPNLRPDLQILFMGDPAQLPPINEKLSKVATLPHFTELTEVVRYDGAILDYCNGVRTVPDYELLHMRIEEDDSLLILPQHEVMAALPEVYASGESIRFVAATNARVSEINYMVRSLLKGEEKNGGLFYEPGDVVLTTNAVSRQGSGAFDVATKGKESEMECHTSTLLELGEMVGPGDFVSLGTRGGTRLSEGAFAFKSALGNTFERMAFRYCIYESGDPFGRDAAIMLINPDQWHTWKQETKQLLSRAKTTQSRSKKRSGARGQEGDQAKAVWAEFGLKDWYTTLDGRTLTDYEYKQIRSQLWRDYFDLLGFADDASYSYASTCHRCQGVTLDVVIVDMRSVVPPVRQSWRNEEGTWDTRKLLYTAATRARKQVIFMV
ncbi:MAG: AAA family ATPase [Cyanobacteria bacterium P01_A01_bin.17]